MTNRNSLRVTQELLNNGSISCVELVNNYLNEIENKKHLNAFLEVFTEEAKERALALDAKKTNKGRLFGLVIGLKDNICYKDHKLSASSKMLEGFESLFSATAVERLLEEDAIIIGRLNCDEFAMGSSNENSAYGNVLNSIDQTRSPGGSSGGSAVAVQAGLCMATLGSDTGGSIRQPASFCGVVGMKPTYGRVSRHGLIAFASSFDQIGPFTNTPEDAALILEVIAGEDPYDATALRSTWKYDPTPFKGKKQRIAYFQEALDSKGIDSSVKQAFMDTIQKLQEAGHEVESVSFPNLKYVIPAYYILTTAEASSNLSRYDGVHYGYRSPNAKNMEDVYVKSRTEGFGKEVKNRIMLGTFVLSAGYYDAYYAKGQKTRRILTKEVNKIYEKFDVILSPTAPSTAFKLGEIDDPVKMYLSDIYTVLANLVGNPAISLPTHKDENGLPIGMQLMVKNNDESRLFALSEELTAQ